MESRNTASRAVGRSASRPSTPRDLWCVRWYGLNEALYGIPIGRFAKMAIIRFALGDLKAKLWDISCIARKRFWFAVAPMIYAVRKNFQEKNGVF